MGSTRRLTELRRALPLAAAALLVLALVVPVWRITLEAPQYPESLVVDLYAYPRLGGDYEEVQLLNSYVGFYYPDPVFVEPNYAVHERAIAVPEWLLGPVAFVGVAATGVFVALAPTVRKLELGLTCQLVGTIGVFVAMFAVIQLRLHQAGHALDPDAPLGGVDGFTPPIVGTYEVANITGLAWFGPGGYMALLAVALLVVAFRLRDSGATVREAPELVRRSVEDLRTRIAGDRDGAVVRPATSRDGTGRSAGRASELPQANATEPRSEPTSETNATHTRTANADSESGESPS